MAWRIRATGDDAESLHAWADATWLAVAEAAGLLHPACPAHRQQIAEPAAVFASATRVLHPWLTAGHERADVSWRDRAEQAGAAYGPGITRLDFGHSWNGSWCYVGQLDLRSQLSLIQLLEQIVPPDTAVNFYWGTAALVCGQPSTVFQGLLGELPAIQSNFVCWGSGAPIFGPESWWPDDHSWLVHTDYDSSGTDVMGPAALAAILRDADVFETFAL